jgi:hypothetical protein
MPTTANMSLILPTEGGSADVWDTLLNAALTLVDSHDHTAGKGVQVPSAGLKINADIAWSFAGTSYAITGAKAIDFAPAAAAGMTSYASALFVNSSDANNLYFRNESGTNVKITDGSTINVSIVGGIGGDYASISALVDYVDSSDTYRFRQQTATLVRQYAKMESADLALYEYLAAGATPVPPRAVTLKSPASLAAAYSLTMPAALPGAAALIQTSTVGVLSASNTLTANVTAPDFRFTTARSLILPASASIDPNGTHTRLLGASSSAQVGWTVAASANRIQWALPLESGITITGWTIYVRKRTNGSATITGRLFQTLGTNGVESTAGLGSGDSDNTNAPGYITLAESGLSAAITTDTQYYLVFTPSASVTPAADELFHALITYTRP